MLDSETKIQRVKSWLTNIVIGLNLCPFAAHPWNQNTVRIKLSRAETNEAVESDLLAELNLLHASAPESVETTLLVTPHIFSDFYDYFLFLDQADALLKRAGLKGEIQIASFHPKYQFAGTNAEDIENLTNRAPYPIFHLLREDSLASAIKRHPDTGQIYQSNIEKMQQLSEEDIGRLFNYPEK